MQKKIVIFGATSSIAQEAAKLFAQEKAHLFLVGRNQAHLKTIAADLKIRGCEHVDFAAHDLADCDRHASIIEQAQLILGKMDIVLIAYGTLSDNSKNEDTVPYVLRELQTNLLSHISLLMRLAPIFEAQKKGCIAVISSVAGDRGRQSNYIYGTAKGGLSIFLQGLRNRLKPSTVNVLTIKPGFVDTPMTKKFKKGLLWTNPDKIAKRIVHAIEKNQQIVYAPWFWRYIMMFIKLIPERIFCKLSL